MTSVPLRRSRHRQFVAAVLAAFVAPAGSAAIPVTPDFTVAAVNFEFPVSAARAGNGNYIFSWTDQDAEGLARPVPYARIFHGDGSAAGPVLQLLTPNQTDEIDRASVAAAADGSFAVAWSDFAAPFSNIVYYARRYAVNGIPISPVITVGTADYSSAAAAGPSVAMDADGDFAVAWESVAVHRFGPGFGYARPATVSASTLARRFAADGSPRGPEFVVDRDPPRPASLTVMPQAPKVAMNAAGEFVVVRARIGSLDQGLSAYRYRADGSAAGSPARVTLLATVNNREISAAIADDASFVVLWTAGNAPRAQLNFRRFDSLGRALTRTTVVSTDPSAVFSSVASDAAGNFVAVWLTRFTSAGGRLSSGVRGQAYSAAGTPRGAPFMIAREDADTQNLPVVASDGAGNFGVAWQNTHFVGDEFSFSIQSQLFAAP